MCSDSLSILLSPSLGAFVLQEAHKQGFQTPDQYVQAVLEAQRRKSAEQLDQLLDEAIASGPAVEYTAEMWKQRRDEMVLRLNLTDET